MAATHESEWLQPHRRALEAGDLSLQRCTNCGYLRWPLARFCPVCLSEAAEWTEVSGRGCLWSFAVSRRNGTDAEGPYILAAVTLEEGPFLFGRLIGDPAALKVDDPVQAHVARVGDRPVLRFSRVGE
jgi:uncharacterized OB-fold protein